MKYLSLAALALLALTGCNTEVGVTPTFVDTNIQGRTISAFKGNVDGVNTFIDDIEFTCSEFVVIDRATGLPYTGLDGVDDTCLPELYSFISLTEADLPLYERP